MTRTRLEWAAAGAVAIAAGCAFLAQLPAHALLGWDSYPEVLTSRILGLGDFLGTFSEQTSEGFYPSAFYRPVHNLVIAADYALWGIEPAGYQRTTVALVLACGLASFWLARRLLGPDAIWGAGATLVGFLLLPVHRELIPVVSRRMDVLCGLFSLLALATQIPRMRTRRPPGGVLPACFTLLAVGSKESGVVVVPLVFLMGLLLRSNAPPKDRLVVAGRVALTHLAAVASVFAARYFAIGGLGGHASTDVSALFTGLPRCLGRTLLRIGSAWPIPRGGIDAVWYDVAAGAAVLVAGGLCAWLLRGAFGSDRSREPRGELAVAALGLSWIILLSGIHAVAGRLQPHYLFQPSIGLALVLGALVEGLLRVRSGGRRRAARLGLAAVLVWAILLGRYSPLFSGYGAWDRGAVAVGRYLADLDARIAAAGDTGYVGVPLPPLSGRADPNPIGATIATWLNVYSLPAWAQLRFPERRILFQYVPARQPPPEPRPGTVIVGLQVGKAEP